MRVLEGSPQRRWRILVIHLCNDTARLAFGSAEMQGSAYRFAVIQLQYTYNDSMYYIRKVDLATVKDLTVFFSNNRAKAET